MWPGQPGTARAVQGRALVKGADCPWSPLLQTPAYTCSSRCCLELTSRDVSHRARGAVRYIEAFLRLDHSAFIRFLFKVAGQYEKTISCVEPTTNIVVDVVLMPLLQNQKLQVCGICAISTAPQKVIISAFENQSVGLRNNVSWREKLAPLADA